MGLLLLVLLLAILFAGFGIAIHLLWIVAAVILVFWLAGFAFRSGSGGGRWYYW